MISGGIRQHMAVGPDSEDAKISKKFVLVENDLKHPQTTIESRLNGFGGDWDKLG